MVGGMDIVIAGGGVAGLEALLALGALAGDRARLTLVAPDRDFVYKPLAVAEPFALAAGLRVPLERFAADAGAELVHDAVESVDDAAGEVRLGSRRRLRYDALLVAPGARAVDGLPGATTWRPGGDPASTAASCATWRRATRAGWRSSSRPARPGRSRPTSSR